MLVIMIGVSSLILETSYKMSALGPGSNFFFPNPKTLRGTLKVLGFTVKCLVL